MRLEQHLGRIRPALTAFFSSYLQTSFIERYLNTAFSNQRKTFSGIEEVFYTQEEDGDAPIFKSIHDTYTSYVRR